MSKLDKLKEELEWLKAVFTISIIMDMSMIGYIFLSHSDISAIKFFLVIMAIVINSIFTILIIFISYKKIKKLEEL